jgi:alpha-L-fucosidase
LELWQFHGPSTRRVREDGGSHVYLHLTARPYERAVVRGIPIRRVERVRLLSDGRELPFSVHPRLSDVHARVEDAFGELHIAVDPSLLDPLCTVLVVDLAASAEP